MDLHGLRRAGCHGVIGDDDVEACGRGVPAVVSEHDAATFEIGLGEAGDRPRRRRHKRHEAVLCIGDGEDEVLGFVVGSSAVRSCRVIDMALPFPTVRSRSAPMHGGTLRTSALRLRPA